MSLLNYYDAGGCLPARLQLAQQGMSGQVLLIESATMGEGKTTIPARRRIWFAGSMLHKR